MPYKYAYLLGDLILFAVWSILFLRKDLRKEILTVSIIGGVLGPLSEAFYIRDYWQPQLFNGWTIGIEDFLFGFFFTGITASIYEEVFGKRFIKKASKPFWIFNVVPLVFTILFLLYLLVFRFGLNSIYASIAIFLLLSIVIMYTRRDLFKDSIMSGFLVSIIGMLGYFLLLNFFPRLFDKFWMMHNISGITMFNVPIEEILWAFSFGMFLGPYWEFLKGYKLGK